MGMSFLDAAAGLVSVGFKVFPLVPGGRLPLIKAWQKVASDDDEQLGEWARQWPDANVAVATGEISDVAVVDPDVKDGRDGIRDLAELAKRGKTLPPCPIALTPSGGRHMYFRMVPGLRNVVGLPKSGRGLAAGIDVRAEGGFVVAPPSVVDTGRYRWIVPPMTPDFPRLPDWAVKMLLPPPAQPRPTFHADPHGSDIEGPARFVARAPEGTRNHSLFWASCRAGEQGIDEKAAFDRLAKAAADAGLPAHEAKLTILSGFKTGKGGSGR